LVLQIHLRTHDGETSTSFSRRRLDAEVEHLALTKQISVKRAEMTGDATKYALGQASG
jgi:hypothetical protein